LVAVGLGLGACTSTSNSSSQTGSGQAAITPSAARSVLTKTDKTNNTANASYNSSLLRSYESGSAFAIDDASYRQDELARKAKDPIGANEPFTVKPLAYSLSTEGPSAGSWVVVGTQENLGKPTAKAPICNTALVFDRPASGDSWHIILEPTLAAGYAPSFAVGSGDRAQRPPVSLSRRVDAVPGRIRQALLSEETSGRLGPFTKADFNRPCGSIPNPRSDVTQAQAAGFDGRDLFSVATPSDTHAYELKGGSALVIFTLGYSDQIVAGSGEAIPWQHTASAANPAPPFVYLLGAGDYSAVDEAGELELAVVVSPSGSLSVVGSYPGVTRVTGVPSKVTTPGSSGPGVLTSKVTAGACRSLACLHSGR
jgi:hypothetical protein